MCRHIKFRRRRIAQKKAYNNQNKGKFEIKITRTLPAESIIMNRSSPQHYLAFCIKNLAYYSFETGHVLSFIAENVRLLAH
jgi:hypothetical protein